MFDPVNRTDRNVFTIAATHEKLFWLETFPWSGDRPEKAWRASVIL